MVRSPLTAARAPFALKAGEWFRRGRLLMVSPVHGDYRRYQAEIPLIALSKFPRPALVAHFLWAAEEVLEFAAREWKTNLDSTSLTTGTIFSTITNSEQRIFRP